MAVNESSTGRVGSCNKPRLPGDRPSLLLRVRIHRNQHRLHSLTRSISNNRSEQAEWHCSSKTGIAGWVYWFCATDLHRYGIFSDDFLRHRNCHWFRKNWSDKHKPTNAESRSGYRESPGVQKEVSTSRTANRRQSNLCAKTSNRHVVSFRNVKDFQNKFDDIFSSNGDSGAGLMKQSDSYPSYWYLVGVTSFGE